VLYFDFNPSLIFVYRHSYRLRHANNAAAAFYTKCLVAIPTAGKARAYLRSRKISPDSIRTFALGYAPDCYYGDEATKATWGEGSLVGYLAMMGFSPNEIVEAGLAVRTNTKSPNKESKYPTNQLKASADDNNDDYSDLMDRFRNRLVVPILDKSGKNVIGFGGRHLDSAREAGTGNSSYIPAKYINSPDSSVFRKKVRRS
jgi:DNA primase